MSSIKRDHRFIITHHPSLNRIVIQHIQKLLLVLLTLQSWIPVNHRGHAAPEICDHFLIDSPWLLHHVVSHNITICELSGMSLPANYALVNTSVVPYLTIFHALVVNVCTAVCMTICAYDDVGWGLFAVNCMDASKEEECLLGFFVCVLHDA